MILNIDTDSYKWNDDYTGFLKLVKHIKIESFAFEKVNRRKPKDKKTECCRRGLKFLSKLDGNDITDKRKQYSFVGDADLFSNRGAHFNCPC